MAKPIIQRVVPFDATTTHPIPFTWSGNQSYKNRLIVSDATTLEVIYDNTVSTFSLSHSIPSNTLTNGKRYVCQVQVFDYQNTASALSDKMYFYCFSTPKLTFIGIEDDTYIHSNVINAEVEYEQAEWDTLQSYTFQLYNAGKVLIDKSDALFDVDEPIYTYRGLANQTTYYLRCVGVTVNEATCDTGYIKITTAFEEPDTYARLYANNEYEKGFINYHTNIIEIQYNGSEVFDIKDSWIDLTEKELTYDNNFNIADDFTVWVKGTNLYREDTFLILNNGYHTITVTTKIYDDDTIRFKLIAKNGLDNYLLYSDPLTITNDDIVIFCIKRKNKLYDMEAWIDTDPAATNLWVGDTQPKNKNVNKYDKWITVNQDKETEYVIKDLYTEFNTADEPTDAEVNNLWTGGA